MKYIAIVVLMIVLGMLPMGAQGDISKVWAPVKVATAPSDAYIGLSLLEDGTLRYYNYGEQAEMPTNFRRGAINGSFYMESKNHGMTWRKVKCSGDIPQADVRSPRSGEYIRLVNDGKSTFCIRTEGGLDGDRTVRKISSVTSIMMKPPVFVRNNSRIVVCAQGGVTPRGCYTYVSDDDGLTWKRSNTVTTPDHVKGGVHQGTRWNHGAVEPTVVELKDGRLWMLMRTSQDFHYESFSTDGGLTWSDSRPSIFWGTITMPTLGRLADGKLLLLWCNTTPLPELPTATGYTDDVFTNRDVCHVAVSDDDGHTWKGCRELMLNPLRNAGDFGSNNTGIDKSMHQAQFVEVAPGKICAAIGQHEQLRSVVLFDVNWALESERSCDLSSGLDQWCVFNYKKGIVGHCAYNRVAGLEVKDGVLPVAYKADTTLVNDNRGAVWNFPTSQNGTLELTFSIPANDEGISLLLNDHWMNPCDTVARHYAMAEILLSRKALRIHDNALHTLRLQWTNAASAKGTLTLFVDGKKLSRKPLLKPTPLGINYLHLLSDRPTQGILLKSVKATAGT